MASSCSLRSLQLLLSSSSSSCPTSFLLDPSRAPAPSICRSRQRCGMGSYGEGNDLSLPWWMQVSSSKGCLIYVKYFLNEKLYSCYCYFLLGIGSLNLDLWEWVGFRPPQLVSQGLNKGGGVVQECSHGFRLGVKVLVCWWQWRIRVLKGDHRHCTQ